MPCIATPSTLLIRAPWFGLALLRQMQSSLATVWERQARWQLQYLGQILFMDCCCSSLSARVPRCLRHG